MPVAERAIAEKKAAVVALGRERPQAVDLLSASDSTSLVAVFLAKPGSSRDAHIHRSRI